MANKDWNELLDLNLNGDKKIQVLNFVMDNLNDEKQLHMTQKEISEKTGVSSRTIAETMKALQESEFFNKVQSGIYQVNSKFEHGEEIRKPQGLEIDIQKINDSLENLTVKNLIDQSVQDVRETLEKDIDNPDTPNLTKADIKDLLEQHLKNIEDALDKYNVQKEKGVTWKDRINTFKGSLQKSFKNFKESLKQKARSVRDAPVNLKNYVKNKLIDGVVKINNKIINKTNAINEKMEQSRPNKSLDNLKENQQNSQHDVQEKVQKAPVNKQDESSIVDYKTEYKKHLMDNFKGQTENDINKASIHTIDSHLVAKPHLAIALRQEAISELRKEILNSNDKSLDIQKFNSYLNDKSDLLAHATKHFEPLQQNQLLEEDLKFEPYKEPEKSINTLYKEVKEAEKKVLHSLDDYKVGDQFFPNATNLEIVQAFMDRNKKLEAYEEKSGEKFQTSTITNQDIFEKYKGYLREEIAQNEKFGKLQSYPNEVIEELNKFEPYKEPEKSIETLYKEVKEADKELLNALGNYKSGDQFLPNATDLQRVQLFMIRNEKLEAYEEKSGEKFQTFKTTDQNVFEKYKDYLREEIAQNEKFGKLQSYPNEVIEELNKPNIKSAEEPESSKEELEEVER